jgi:2'-5' RNA ligase
MSYNLTMTMTEKAGISDIPFDEYNKRQLYEISATRNRERAVKAKPAGNFLYSDGSWLPQEYEGFAIVSMLNDNDGNQPLISRLTEIQKELKYNLSPCYAFYQLPVESFHQTVANTLSADRFKEHILNAGLEESYPSIVAGAFEQIQSENSAGPIKMKMAGLSIFGTAIGILGVFENEEDYNRIVNFRTGFYNDTHLSQLDVKMTRPFIGHITLAYVEHNLNKNQKEHLADAINEINETLENEQLYFNITHTGLRRYHHLAEFIKQDNYPVYTL